MVKQVSLLALILLLLSWPLISKSQTLGQTYPRELPTVAPAFQ